MTEELDELNRLFTSKNVEDVIKFYDHFDTAEQLIEWMKNRPSAPMKIYEVEGDKDIVVVIPTANHEGELAKNCANNIFKGQQIIFVESNGPFFNYARSCNYGLKHALNYNPKWVVLSNDDVYKTDGILKLKDGIEKINGNNYNVIWINGSVYHSSKVSFCSPTIFLGLYYKLNKFKNERYNIYKKYSANIFIRNLNKKFVSNLLFKPLVSFYSVGDFSIFNANFIRKKEKVFDENFINSEEDIYLSYILFKNKTETTKIDFNVYSYIGKSLGLSNARNARGIINDIYINSLIKMDFATKII